MTVTLGSLTLAAGSRAEPCRLLYASGTRQWQRALLVRSANGGIYDRGNRQFTDTIEVTYTYATPADAVNGLAARRSAALSAPPGILTYGGQVVGYSAIITDYSGECFGCTAVVRITIQGLLSL